MPIFCSINIVFKYVFIVADSFLNTLDCYMPHTTAVAIILSLFYEYMRVNVLTPA